MHQPSVIGYIAISVPCSAPPLFALYPNVDYGGEMVTEALDTMRAAFDGVPIPDNLLLDFPGVAAENRRFVTLLFGALIQAAAHDDVQTVIPTLVALTALVPHRSWVVDVEMLPTSIRPHTRFEVIDAADPQAAKRVITSRPEAQAATARMQSRAYPLGAVYVVLPEEKLVRRFPTGNQPAQDEIDTELRPAPLDTLSERQRWQLQAILADLLLATREKTHEGVEDAIAALKALVPWRDLCVEAREVEGEMLCDVFRIVRSGSVIAEERGTIH